MDERNHSHNDPWDRDFYETGSTKPPKERSGLIAIILIVVIGSPVVKAFFSNLWAKLKAGRQVKVKEAA